MARRHFGALAAFGIAVIVASPVLSCTTVCLLETEKAVVAYNYDFHSREVPAAAKDTLAAHPSVTSSCAPAG